MFGLRLKELTVAAIAACTLGVGSAQSATIGTLTAFGITYELSGTIGATGGTFTLDISGINGATDTEGGRYGVNAFAFSNPLGGTSVTGATAPAGFTYANGGLNSSGCDGHGAFFCFAADTTPTGPVLAANSTLSYTFSISTSPDAFPANWLPSLKIDWVGTKNNYDLVSTQLNPPSNVPVPASLPLIASGLGLMGFMAARRKRKAA